VKKPWVPLAVSFVTLAIIGVFATKHCMQKGRKQREAATQRQTSSRTQAKERRRLDVARFREDVARRRAKVKALPRPTTTYNAPTTKGRLTNTLMTPSCILGPGDMCESLADLVDACDHDDGASCLAIAQFLQETPPRPLAATLFINMACTLGEAAACERRDRLKTAPTAPCSEDPYWCGWYAFQKSDEVLADEACLAGVADACAMLVDKVENEPALVQRYLAEACQLGNPMACTALADTLATTDPEQAAAARAIGCAAGFEQACK